MASVLELPHPKTYVEPKPMKTNAPMPTGQTGKLFLISVLGLFLELLLIRWVSTEIRIFAYLQNTVLVVCFLGLGMGCWTSRKGFALRDLLLPLLVLVTLLAIPVTRIALGEISTMLSGFEGMHIWGQAENSGWQIWAAPTFGIILTLGLMLLLWEIFLPVGRLLGRLMDDHPHTIWAYSVNVAGSLVGIWLFVAFSALYLPPIAWFAAFAVGAMFLIGTGGKSKLGDVGILAAILALAGLAGVEPGWKRTMWSPYQKLALYDQTDQSKSFWESIGGTRTPGGLEIGECFIGVNNIGYQAMMDLRPETIDKLAQDPKNLSNYPPDQRGLSQYDLPAKLHPNPKKLLVVGAGSGNDVAGALRNGAGEVVGVEIDPAIIAFGRELHPEKPYSSPKVRVVNDDARSYFATADEKFDVIAFGLLDSHTTTAMTNARLDHYVYTKESLEQAKRLLNPGGVIVLSFEAQKPYIADRMSRAIAEVFGHKPRVFKIPHNGMGWGGVVFLAGDMDNVNKQLDADPRMKAIIEKWEAATPVSLPGVTEMAVDDWPYIYLEHRSIPSLYLLLAFSLLLLFFRGIWKLELGSTLRKWDRTQSHFFFLGAAFMLLEVQNISKAAVVLGNTWIVNAVIISGVLLMILAANAIAAKFPKLPTGLAYALLIASCIVLYMIDLSTFAFLPYATKALIVGLLTSLPMLFSGIVFIRSFANVERKDAALGANLMGSLVGGLLQTVTFLTGIKALLLIVACLYVAALLSRPKAIGAKAVVA